ncbi:MAG: hypothetical protein WCT33_03065 [Patescibacteria group bacterium]
MNALLGFALVVVAVMATLHLSVRSRGGNGTNPLAGFAGLQLNVKRKSWYSLPVAYIVGLLLGHFRFGWKWSDSSAFGIALMVLAVLVLWYRATPADKRFGGMTIGAFLKSQHKLIMWLVFHFTLWSVVTELAGWEYTKEWLNGKFSLLYYPMSAIYVCRGVLPDEIKGQSKFGNRITQAALAILFVFMHVEIFYMHVPGRGSLLQAIPSYNESGSANLPIPGLFQADSDVLAPGAFNAYVIPEGRDSNGVQKRMLIGTLPAGTTWVRVFRVEGRVYTDKLIYDWAKNRLAVDDAIRVGNYNLPSPDTDHDGFLDLNQSPLWLIVGENLVGWKVIHPDLYILTAPLGADTSLYALIKSDQADKGTGFAHLVIQSGT